MSAGAAAAAAAKQLADQQEEESMTDYRDRDLDGWEFKILRSAFGAFDKPEKLQEALAEEARSGWELLEKFDDKRIRLKRPVSARSSDRGSMLDPYRTYFGTNPNKAGAIAAVVFVAIITIVVVVAIAVD